jgi:hypothetical protein
MAWTELAGGDPPQRLAIAAYSLSTLGTNGVFVGGAAGATIEYFSGYGFCASPTQYAAFPVRFVRRVGDDIVLVPDNVESSGQIVIAWLTSI